jgi:hypothetical protein
VFRIIIIKQIANKKYRNLGFSLDVYFFVLVDEHLDLLSADKSLNTKTKVTITIVEIKLIIKP